MHKHTLTKHRSYSLLGPLDTVDIFKVMHLKVKVIDRHCLKMHIWWRRTHQHYLVITNVVYIESQ